MDLRTIGHQSYVESIRKFVEHCVDGFERQFGSVRLLATGAPTEHFNNVVADSAPADPGDIEAAIAWCHDQLLPYTVVLRESVEAELQAGLARHGLKPPDDPLIPVMVTTERAAVTWPDHLGRLDGIEAYEAHLALTSTVFSIPPDLVASLVSPTVSTDPDITLIVGVEEGIPVTTALGTITNRVIGIYNVATLAEFRGRGYGATMTGTVLNEGFAKGAHAGALQSSPAGFGVYERLGFQTVDHHDRWTRPIGVPAAG